MACLTQLGIRNFRTLKAVDLAPDRHANLISGHNGAGKTSLLETIFLLSRGRSFRGSDVRQLVARDADSANLRAVVAADAGGARELGVALQGRTLRPRLDGKAGVPRAELARSLPVLNLDASVVDLVNQGPERRRLMLNWVTFHVEPRFHSAWKGFRRSLKQRNASLREGAGARQVTAWDAPFCRAVEAMEEQRRAVAESLRLRFRQTAEQLLGIRADWDYYPGWPRGKTLAEALGEALDGDRKLGLTRFGPQRSDLALRLQAGRARHVASRGQQKLLAASLMLAAAKLLAETGVGKPVLLADEPLVELDANHAGRLLGAMSELRMQLFITAVDTAPFGKDFRRREFRLNEGRLV